MQCISGDLFRPVFSRRQATATRQSKPLSPPPAAPWRRGRPKPPGRRCLGRCVEVEVAAARTASASSRTASSARSFRCCHSRRRAAPPRSPRGGAACSPAPPSRWMTSASAVLHADRVAAIDGILAAHAGPIPRVRLARTRFRGDGDGHGAVDGAGLDADCFAGRCVEELVVHSTHSLQFFPSPPLRSLQLVHCDWRFPPSAAAPPCFAHLRELSLLAVKISERDLHALVGQCNALQSLLLSSYRKGYAPEQVDIARFHLRSPSLRSLSLELCDLTELVVVDAPNLERLLGEPMYDRRHCEVTIVHAPKLQILGFLSMKFHLVDYNAVYKGMHLALSSSIRSVKTLALCMNLCDVAQVKQILQFLSYFPRLETLHIKNFYRHNEDLRIPEHSGTSSCLELASSVACLRDTVKTIVLSLVVLNLSCNLPGHFFAKVLKVMRILRRTLDKAWIKTNRRLLGLESNASLSGRVVFVRDNLGSAFRDIVWEASNLAIPDPFFVRRISPEAAQVPFGCPLGG